MRAWVWFLVLALAISGAEAAEKKDKGGKDKAVLKAEPKLPPGDLAVQQAEERLRAGQHKEALTALRQATQVEGMTGEPFLRLAALIENSQEVDTAAANYKIAAERLSGAAKAEALARLSLLQDTLGAPDEARASAQAAQGVDPEGAWPATALAHLRAREGKADEALALAQKAVAAGGPPAAKAALGFAQETGGNLAAAETAYREALAQEPDRAATTVGLARVLRKTGRAAEADQLITRALDQTPWLVEAYKESVEIKVALGQFMAALEQATTAATLNENDKEAQRLVDEVKVARALDYVKNGQPDLAIEDLVKLRDEKPRAASVRIGLAKAYIAKRQLDLAQAELTKAIEIDTNAAEAHFQLGILLHEGKNAAAAALPEYEKAVTLAPQDIDYRIRLGNLLSGQKQSERAITELRTVVEGKGASRADAWTYLGGAYLQAGRYDDAIGALAKAFELLPDVPANRAARGLAADYISWAYLNKADKESFIKYGSLARDLGYKERDPELMKRLAAIERGEGFAATTPAKPAPKPRPRRR
jgi:tetratricopeptide (TPR) repeat protein